MALLYVWSLANTSELPKAFEPSSKAEKPKGIKVLSLHRALDGGDPYIVPKGINGLSLPIYGLGGSKSMMVGTNLRTWWVQVNDEPGPELILINWLGGSKSMRCEITV